MCTYRMDADDLTALDVALLMGNSAISALLVNHGARAHLTRKTIWMILIDLHSAQNCLYYCNRCNSYLQEIAVAKLMYASCAWFRFANKTDQQRVDAYLRRSIRNVDSVCPPELPSFQDERWHHGTPTVWPNSNNNNHLLFNLLPPPSTSSQNYYISRQDHTASSFVNELDISLTLFLHECFSNTFINIFYINFIVYLSPIVMKLRFVSFLLYEYWIGLELTKNELCDRSVEWRRWVFHEAGDFIRGSVKLR